jgi:hypothetical protein
MPLNLRKNSGEFTPYLKYNAKAGRWYVKGEQGEVEVMLPRLVFDMPHVKTGWLYYEEGSGPEKVWDPSPTVEAPKPAGGKKFKRGFEVMVFGPDKLDGANEKIGLREFSSTADNCIAAFVDMYSQYENAMKSNPGKLPFFGCTGVQAISGRYGTNYEPTFKLIGWVERSKIPEFDVAKPDTSPPADDWQAPLEHPSKERPEDALDDAIPF